MRKTKIPTLIAILIITIGISISVLLTQEKQLFLSSARPQDLPKDVKTSNITDSSFTVTWTTQNKASGAIVWGESKNSQNQTVSEETNTNGYTHSATIRNLKPNTNYYFKVASNGNLYDDNGSPWEVKTSAQLHIQRNSTIQHFSGTIVSSLGDPVPSALVFIKLEGASLISTFTSKNGNWVVPVTNIRTRDLNNFYEISGEETVEIYVQAGPGGIASAQIYAQNASSTPLIKLGETYDFRDLATTQNDTPPASEIQTPQGAERKPRFNVNTNETPTIQSDTISVESVEEGEIINTTTPEFFGKAPPNEKITLTVESPNPQSDSVVVDKDGFWRWSPPLELTPGEHRLILSYRDKNGILKTLTRSFIVKASEAEGPAFEATPSASLTPTPLLTPTASPLAQQTTSPSATPDQPISGTKTPTLILFSLGLLLFAGSGFLLFAN